MQLNYDDLGVYFKTMHEQQQELIKANAIAIELQNRVMQLNAENDELKKIAEEADARVEGWLAKAETNANI